MLKETLFNCHFDRRDACMDVAGRTTQEIIPRNLMLHDTQSFRSLPSAEMTGFELIRGSLSICIIRSLSLKYIRHKIIMAQIYTSFLHASGRNPVPEMKYQESSARD